MPSIILHGFIIDWPHKITTSFFVMFSPYLQAIWETSHEVIHPKIFEKQAHLIVEFL